MAKPYETALEMERREKEIYVEGKRVIDFGPSHVCLSVAPGRNVWKRWPAPGCIQNAPEPELV